MQNSFKFILIYGIFEWNIDKTALDYAKEKNYAKIVELLSNGPIRVSKEEKKSMRTTLKISILEIKMEQLMKDVEEKQKQNQPLEKDNSLMKEVYQLSEELNLIKNEKNQLQANNEVHTDDN